MISRYIARTLCQCCALLLVFGATALADPTSSANERWAAMTSPLFTHITADSGLPDNALTALAQDADGFIWIGTQSGVTRYDGYSFRLFRYDPKDATSLPADYVQALYVDRANNLWIGTATGGVARLDRTTERFIRYPVGGPHGLSAANVLAITGDGAGGIWVGTEGGLDHLDPASGNVVSYRHVEGQSRSLPDSNVQALTLAADRSLWIGTNSGLVRMKPGSNEFESFPIIDPENQHVVTDPVYSLATDDTGKLWFGTGLHGIGSVEADKGARLIESKSPENADLRTQSVHGIIVGADRKMWLATYGAGLFTFDPASGSLRQIHHNQSDTTSLADDQCLAILLDRSGELWVATEQGVSRTDPTATAIQTVMADPARPDRLAEANAIGLLTDRRGRLWIGYHSGGVDVFDPHGHRVAALRPDPANRSALPKRSVPAFAEEPDGSMWIGTTVGLYHSDADARHLSVAPTPVNGGHPYVQTLLIDGDILWVGTQSGMLRYDRKKSAWHTYTTADANGVSDNRVTALVQRGDGRMWVGTMHGLNVFDPRAGTFAPVGSLTSEFVADMMLDLQGRLWVGTSGGGIFVVRDSGGGKFDINHLGTAEGLPNANIDALQRDTQGRMWASTDNGIAMVDPANFHVRSFFRADGAQFRNYWNHASALTAEGDVLFGGLGGLSVVHPQLVHQRLFTAPTVVSEIRVGGRQVPTMDLNGQNGMPGALAPLVVNPEDRAFQIEFASLDYSAPHRNRYAYKLEGYDSDWVSTDASKRVAVYTNMAPGDYRLLIRGSNRDGVWTQRELAIPFKVLPAWYQTWLFRLLLAAAAIALVMQLIHMRTAYLRRSQLELEAIVAKRTEELRQSKLQLEEIAFLDALTGLPNRRLFAERFENFRALAERNGTRFALLLVDLDKFKLVNDTYGHDAGDAVLVVTAERLKLATRAVDFVGRLGGDEFAVLLDHLDPESTIEAVCQRIIKMFAEPIAFSQQELPMSASIGVAIFGVHGSTQAELYKAADLALYEAKNHGRNTWFCSRLTVEQK
ncbi:MAG: diguanylate cyclase [Burkholderiaceae bacterium]|nr:diguanylate cyclase [Burkholderiaceae bacterium]